MLVSLLMVVGVKFFTATKMRNLERRLNRVKEGLQTKKEEFHSVLAQQQETQVEEGLSSERIRSMKELIHDMGIRLQTADQEPQMAVDLGGLPPLM
jgi:uncharacterized protein YaaR (DUF327 family)